MKGKDKGNCRLAEKILEEWDVLRLALFNRKSTAARIKWNEICAAFDEDDEYPAALSKKHFGSVLIALRVKKNMSPMLKWLAGVLERRRLEAIRDCERDELEFALALANHVGNSACKKQAITAVGEQLRHSNTYLQSIANIEQVVWNAKSKHRHHPDGHFSRAEMVYLLLQDVDLSNAVCSFRGVDDLTDKWLDVMGHVFKEDAPSSPPVNREENRQIVAPKQPFEFEFTVLMPPAYKCIHGPLPGVPPINSEDLIEMKTVFE